MRITFDIPDTLFFSSTIVEKIEQKDGVVIVHGKSVPAVLHPREDGWMGHEFGFVTSDVSSLELMDKLLELSKVIAFARKKGQPVEFLFNVYNGSFSIYWRPKQDF